MNKIEKLTKSELECIVGTSKSYTEVLRKIGLKRGNTTLILKKRLIQEDINFDHLKNGQGALWNKGIVFVKLEEFQKHLCLNSSIDRGSLKKYIIRFNLINYTCQLCGQEPEWKNKKLVLVLDHINGIRNDNRIENLRFVCPNCNSQLPTTCRKGCNKRIKWNAKKIVEKIKSGKSIRQCLLDEGVSDGTNYETVKNLCGTLVKLD